MKGLRLRDEYIRGRGPWWCIEGDIDGWEQPAAEFPALCDLIVSHAKHKRHIVQAGGCMGVYPRMFADYFDHVTTFEPDAENFDCLTYNCWDDERISKIQAALGNGGHCHVTRGPRRNAGSHAIGGAGMIPILRLDGFSFPCLDAIQLDCEGYEPNIIDGAAATIARFRPVISIECPSADLTEKLLSWGYQEVGRCGHNPDVVFEAKDTTK